MDSYSIICADDDSHMRSFFSQVLSSRKHKVRTLTDGAEVISAYERQSADLIFLDLDMPMLGGLETCRQLRQHPVAHDVPIIICSSHESEEVIIDALSAGADDYIIKPPKPAELMAKMISAIRKRSESATKELGLPSGNLIAGKYQIKDKLGFGGFSRVYRAVDISSEPSHEVALKVFDTNAWTKHTDDYLAIFLREAYALSKLNHPNIIKFYDFGRTQTHHYLAMEYADGESLRQIIDKTGAMDEGNVAAIGFEMVKVLKYLRERDIVHRDITPQNIMLIESGEIKLVDFGMAKPMQDLALTPTGIFTGSPLYAAPELIMNHPVDCRADIFSLGATLYVICSNDTPFPGMTPQDIFTYRIHHEPIPIQEVAGSISNSIATIIHAMMSRKKEDRPSLENIEKALLTVMTLS